jgi:hypothetical protein
LRHTRATAVVVKELIYPPGIMFPNTGHYILAHIAQNRRTTSSCCTVVLNMSNMSQAPQIYSLSAPKKKNQEDEGSVGGGGVLTNVMMANLWGRRLLEMEMARRP